MNLSADQIGLAALYGVRTSYYDINGVERTASPDALLAILKALGSPLTGWDSGHDALRERQRSLASCFLEPVNMLWLDDFHEVVIRVPATSLAATHHAGIFFEDGTTTAWGFVPESLPDAQVDNYGFSDWIPKRLALPAGLFPGYHQLMIEGPSAPYTTLLIAAPSQSLSPAEAGMSRVWGGFLPLYALKTHEGMGLGDYSRLGQLAEWIGERGGRVLGTLPLLPTYLAKPYDPSPYAPVSRLFWNEFYIDPASIPEFQTCEDVRKQADMLDQMCIFSSLRNDPHVRYKEAFAVKRMLISKLAQHFFQNRTSRWNEFAAFTKTYPDVELYARFRAATELSRKPWSEWGETQRSGSLGEGDYKIEARDFYAYAQWVAHDQLKNAAARAEGSGVGLYLDLPVGVHRDGYDVWHEQDSYANGVDTGAPPDPFFAAGQNWGFSPLQPARLRDRQYQHFIQVIRHHLRYARVLRVDHVMGLHRLYWIPKGAPATEGVYVHYRAQELFGICALEAHRNRAVVVGEDLGTVPDEVRELMSRRNFQRLYVMQFMCNDSPDQAILPVPENAVACMNTHDMVPFRTFWTGAELDQRAKLGFVDPEGVEAGKVRRASIRRAVLEFLRRQGFLTEDTEDPECVFKALSLWIAKSPAWLTQLNLEDIWGEMDPQNVPGTCLEHSNWTRKAARTLDELSKDIRIREILDLWKRDPIR